MNGWYLGVKNDWLVGVMNVFFCLEEWITG